MRFSAGAAAARIMLAWKSGGRWNQMSAVDVAVIGLGVMGSAALHHLAKKLPAERAPSPIDRALDGAIVTPREQWDPQTAARLDAVAGRLVRSN